MEYNKIIKKIKRRISHENLWDYLEIMMIKIEENNGFSKNLNDIYGFYMSFNECVSFSINATGDFEFNCEQSQENDIFRKKTVLLDNLENGAYTIKYYVCDMNLQNLYNSISETLVFNKKTN